MRPLNSTLVARGRLFCMIQQVWELQTHSRVRWREHKIWPVDSIPFLAAVPGSLTPEEQAIPTSAAVLAVTTPTAAKTLSLGEVRDSVTQAAREILSSVPSPVQTRLGLRRTTSRFSATAPAMPIPLAETH